MRAAEGTVERWAHDYVTSSSLAYKLAPPPVPESWADGFVSTRLASPGRPSELRVVDRAEKVRGLRAPLGRARAMHTFFHHELQAAELMAWAVLAFPETPRELRSGLLRVALDEVRHMNLYVRAIERLGHRVGEFAVRDWFWARVPACPDAASFMAVMGLGFESANLEHAATFAARFREAGDEESARVQETVGHEEIAHARFAAKWFAELTGGLEFSVWERSLPAPLSPMLMRGTPLRRDVRKRAGQTDAFLDALEAWSSPA